MSDQTYTLGVWHVQDGRQQEFITAWEEVGEVFAALPDPPGKGTLLQSATDPALFCSFGPWSSMQAVDAMREDKAAGEGLRRLMALCTEASPGAFRVVAEAP